jgi:hypothetical protein
VTANPLSGGRRRLGARPHLELDRVRAGPAALQWRLGAPLRILVGSVRANGAAARMGCVCRLVEASRRQRRPRDNAPVPRAGSPPEPDQSRAVSAPGRALGPAARRRWGLSGGPGCPLHGAA